MDSGGEVAWGVRGREGSWGGEQRTLYIANRLGRGAQAGGRITGQLCRLAGPCTSAEARSLTRNVGNPSVRAARQRTHQGHGPGLASGQDMCIHTRCWLKVGRVVHRGRQKKSTAW